MGVSNRTLNKMVFKTLSTALLLLPFITGQPPPPEECCEMKMVGDFEYRFMMEGMPGLPASCMNACIYKRVDNGKMYCFAPGDLHVECEDEDVTGAPDGGLWPDEPLVLLNYTGIGEIVELGPGLSGYLVRGAEEGAAPRVVVWNYDIFGLYGPLSGMRRSKVWADSLAQVAGYTVIIPDWYRGTNMPAGGFLDPATVPWLMSVTNATRIVEDWEEVVLPYIEELAPGAKIGLIGTCWGSYPVMQLSQFSNIAAGISMHPSHPSLAPMVGETEESYYSQILAPQLFLNEGGVQESIQPGGLAQQILGEKLTIIEFPDMDHGWTTGGNLADPLVMRDYRKAQREVLDFFGLHLM